MNHWTRRAALAAIVGMGTGLAAVSSAQAWPEQPVRFIVPLGAGSGADINARMIAEQLSKAWGQPVVVENRPGAGGIVGIKALLSANDDHTLLFAPASAFAAHPYMHDTLPYDPADLAPVVQISNTVITVTMPANSPYKSLDEFFAAARKSPGKLNRASVTGISDFLMEGFMKENKIDLARVPYKNPVQAVNDLAENRIQLYSSAYAIARTQIEAGRVRMVAVTNSERAPALKDVPTVTELGYPGLTLDGLIGIYGPRDMPQERQDRVAADVLEILKDADVRNRLEQTGQLVSPGGPKVFAASIEKQKATLVDTAKVLGLKVAK